MLTVKKPAEKPSIKKGIEDQFIAVGKPLEIAIEVTYSILFSEFRKILKLKI